MARFVNGELLGKIGKVVLCKGKSGIYIRSAAVRSMPPTRGELKNRYVFKLVRDWLRPVKDFVRLGFRNYNPRYQGFSAAVSVMYQQGLLNNGYESVIEPPRVKLSHGRVGIEEDFQVFLDGNRKLNLLWNPQIDLSNHPRDRLMLLAYNPDAGEAAYDLSGPQRYTGQANLDLSLMPLGTYHLYVAFRSADGTGQSNSKYLGHIEIGSNANPDELAAQEDQ